MSDAVTAWTEAFTKAQAEFPEVKKDKTVTVPTKSGGQYSYQYADLPSILELVNPILKEHGLSIGQSAVSENGSIGVETRVYHKGGHVEAFGPLYLPGGDDAKAAGSAVTYARRYSLCAALGIAADEDDDGGAVSHTSQNADSSQNREVSADDPHCPACLHVNGEMVGVWDNRDKERGPKWKCKNKPDECAGAEPDKNGKLWSWSGWHESWEKCRDEWVDNHPEFGEQIETVEPEEESPGDWLAKQVDMFGQWTPDQRRDAYKAVMEELGFERLSSMGRAEAVFEGLKETYYTEHPDLSPF